MTDYSIENPSKIDSLCHGNPIGADGPTDVWCGNEAINWAYRVRGHRVYVCQEHAEEIDRFDDGVFDGDSHPRVGDCERCQSLTPADRLNHEGICEDCR